MQWEVSSQSRDTYSRGPFLAAMFLLVFSRQSKSLAAECLVGVRAAEYPVAAWIDGFGCLHLVGCRWLFV